MPKSRDFLAAKQVKDFINNSEWKGVPYGDTMEWVNHRIPPMKHYRRLVIGTHGQNKIYASFEPHGTHDKTMRYAEDLNEVRHIIVWDELGKCGLRIPFHYLHNARDSPESLMRIFIKGCFIYEGCTKGFTIGSADMMIRWLKRAFEIIGKGDNGEEEDVETAKEHHRRLGIHRHVPVERKKFQHDIASQSSSNQPTCDSTSSNATSPVHDEELDSDDGLRGIEEDEEPLVSSRTQLDPSINPDEIPGLGGRLQIYIEANDDEERDVDPPDKLLGTLGHETPGDSMNIEDVETQVPDDNVQVTSPPETTSDFVSQPSEQDSVVKESNNGDFTELKNGWTVLRNPRPVYSMLSKLFNNTSDPPHNHSNSQPLSSSSRQPSKKRVRPGPSRIKKTQPSAGEGQSATVTSNTNFDGNTDDTTASFDEPVARPPKRVRRSGPSSRAQRNKGRKKVTSASDQGTINEHEDTRSMMTSHPRACNEESSFQPSPAQRSPSAAFPAYPAEQSRPEGLSNTTAQTNLSGPNSYAQTQIYPATSSLFPGTQESTIQHSPTQLSPVRASSAYPAAHPWPESSSNNTIHSSMAGAGNYALTQIHPKTSNPVAATQRSSFTEPTSEYQTSYPTTSSSSSRSTPALEHQVRQASAGLLVQRSANKFTSIPQRRRQTGTSPTGRTPIKRKQQKARDLGERQGALGIGNRFSGGETLGEERTNPFDRFISSLILASELDDVAGRHTPLTVTAVPVKIEEEDMMEWAPEKPAVDFDDLTDDALETLRAQQLQAFRDGKLCSHALPQCSDLAKLQSS